MEPVRNFEGINYAKSISPIIHTADANGSSVDLQQRIAAAVVASVGITGDTLSGSIYVDIEVQHSDDDSTFAAVPNAQLSATVTGTNVGTIARIDDNAEDDVVVGPVGYLGSKRYIRVVMNLTGTHSNGIELQAGVLTVDKYA